MTSWNGRPTMSGQMRRFRRSIMILREHIRRDVAKHPWAYAGLVFMYIPIRLLVEVL